MLPLAFRGSHSNTMPILPPGASRRPAACSPQAHTSFDYTRFEAVVPPGFAGANKWRGQPGADNRTGCRGPDPKAGQQLGRCRHGLSELARRAGGFTTEPLPFRYSRSKPERATARPKCQGEAQRLSAGFARKPKVSLAEAQGSQRTRMTASPCLCGPRVSA